MTDIDMEAYIRDAVAEYEECRFGRTSGKKLDPSWVLVRETKAQASGARQAADRATLGHIGKILWVMRINRPDIAYAVSRVASTVAAWSRDAEEALAQIFAYLKRTGACKLRLTRGDAHAALQVMTDASWTTPKSQMGWWIGYAWEDGRVSSIAWGSKRINMICESSAAAELIALDYGLKQAEKVWDMLIDTPGEHPSRITLWTDSFTVIQMLRSGESQSMIQLQKALALRLSKLKQWQDEGLVEYRFVPGSQNLANYMTKRSTKTQLQEARRALGLVGSEPNIQVEQLRDDRKRSRRKASLDKMEKEMKAALAGMTARSH